MHPEFKKKKKKKKKKIHTYIHLRRVNNYRITMIPSVLLNALKEFNFVGTPLWRLSDGKDLVRVELTFHKNHQPTSRYVKKRAERRRRQPAPSAGEWPRQPISARRSPMTTTRSTPASRQPTPEKETPPPDTADINTFHYQTSTQATGSRDHTITDHHATNNITSFSGLSASKEDKDKVAEVHDDNRNSTSMTKRKMNILYTRSTTSRTYTPPPTRSS